MTTLTTEFIAYITGTVNDIGADAGISIWRKVSENGQVREETEIAPWIADGTEIDDEDGDADMGLAEAQLLRMGYRLAGAFTSGGQIGCLVEPIS